MRSSPVAALLWTALSAVPASAQQNRSHPLCDALVQPDQLAALSGHAWRSGQGIGLNNDKLVCNFYQDEAPAGLALSVRLDPQKREFNAARELHVRAAESVSGIGDDAFYFRLASIEPFAPTWSLVVYANEETYRLEGVPEAGNAERARNYARELVLRVMKKF